MKLRIYFFLVFSALATIGTFGQDVSETKTWGDQLFRQGHFKEALSAYQRAAFFMRPESDPVLLLQIAECFYATGDYGRAVEYFDHAYFLLPDDSMKAESMMRKADCYLVQQQFSFALLELLSTNTPDSGFQYRKKQLLTGIAYYGSEEYTNAGACFSSAVSAEDTAAKSKIEALFANPKKFFRPNPKAAMWMSVFVPGLGHIRSGAWGSGINSFLLNSFLAGMAIYLSIKFHPLDAIFTISPWFQRYYQGGLQKATDLAEAKREANRDMYYREILAIIAASEKETI